MAAQLNSRSLPQDTPPATGLPLPKLNGPLGAHSLVRAKKGPGMATEAATRSGGGMTGAAALSSCGPDARTEFKSVLLVDVQDASKSISREELAERFSLFARRPVSLTALEKYWNPTKEVKNLAAGDLAAWVLATKSTRALEEICEACGMWLGSPNDQMLRDYGAACLEQLLAQKRREQVEQQMEVA